MFQLPPELPVALEPGGIQDPVLYGLLYGTPGLPFVPAVAEPAVLSKLVDVVKHLLYPLFRPPELEFTHARRVDQITPRGKRHELAMRCRVASPAVLFPHLRGLEFLTPQKAVDQGGLSHARGSKKSGSHAGREVRPAGVNARGRSGVGDVNRCSAADSKDLLQDLVNGRTEIRLVENNHRPCAARGCNGEVPLDPPEVVVVIQSGDEKHDVDVCRRDLLDLLASRCTARKG